MSSAESSKRWREKNPERNSASQRRYLEKYPERARAASKRWRDSHREELKLTREKNKDKIAAYGRAYTLFKRYGLTPEEFSVMLESQGDKCKICQSSDPGGRGTWHVDHDHLTGKVRGLLCFQCNRGLGCFKDDPEIVQVALDYLVDPLVGVQRAVGDRGTTRCFHR